MSKKRIQSLLPLTIWPALLFLAALMLYLPGRSSSLDDFDSYSFVMALDDFDIQLQQPQPPGFPVYVVLGRLFNGLLDDSRIALTTLSALSGAAVIALIYTLGIYTTGDQFTAAVGAVLFAVMPIQWLTAEKALSDMPGLAFSLASVAALWAGKKNPRWFIIGGGLLGLSLGVRPQSNIPGVLLFAWAAWRWITSPGGWRTLAAATAVFVIAVVLWLIPTIHSAGGLDNYRELINAHGRHVWQSDSLFGRGTPSNSEITARAKDFLDTFLVPTLGISVYSSHSLLQVAQLVLLAIFMGGGIILADYSKHEIRAAATWFLVICIPLTLFESLNRPRLMLPALPPLALILLSGWTRLLAQRPRLHLGLFIMVTLALTAQSAPLVMKLSTDLAPHTQAAAYIRENYPAHETLLAAAGSFRTSQVELPEYRLLYRYRFDPHEATAAVASGAYRYIVIMDREVFGDVISILDGDGAYVPINDRTFERDTRIHSQHAQIRVQTLIRANEIQSFMLQIPDSGRIEPGNENFGRYMGQGWFRAEDIGGTGARWAGDGHVSTLRFALEQGQDYTVSFLAAPYPDDQNVIVSANGSEVARIDLRDGWQEYSFILPSTLIEDHAITSLSLAHSRTLSPFEQTGGSSSDRRALTAAYAWFQFDALNTP